MNRNAFRLAPFAAFMLLACGQTNDKPQESTFNAPQKDINAYEKTVISANAADVGGALGELGAPWTSELATKTSADSLSGGSVVSTLFSGASYEVFLNSTNRVWRIRLNSGFSTQCGDKTKLFSAAQSLLLRVEPGVSLSDSDLNSAEEALRDNEIYTADIGSVRVTFSGGCVSSATISAQ
jgi:hypothetical protein